MLPSQGVFADVPQNEIDMSTHENAERLFRFPMTVPADAQVGS